MTVGQGGRLAIVEDHELIAAALAASLEARGHDVLVLDPAADVSATLEALAGWSPDLVLHDLDLGIHGDGWDRIPSILSGGWDVLVVTGVRDPVVLARAVAAGAVGVVAKSTSFEGLVDAIEAALHGSPPLSEHDRHEARTWLRQREQAVQRQWAPFDALTPREAAVLRGLVQGRHVDELAASFTVAPATVRSQVRAILAKLGVSSQLEAVALARRVGWPRDPGALHV